MMDKDPAREGLLIRIVQRPVLEAALSPRTRLVPQSRISRAWLVCREATGDAGNEAGPKDCERGAPTQASQRGRRR